MQAWDRRRHQIDTLVLCSGKIYFALDQLRREHKIENVALVRLEEICPFPVQAIADILKQYPNLMRGHQQSSENIVWLQEEHKNQGAYSFVEARLRNIIGIRKLKYIGREESELPATGSSSLHKRELERIVREFIGLGKQSK